MENPLQTLGPFTEIASNTLTQSPPAHFSLKEIKTNLIDFSLFFFLIIALGSLYHPLLLLSEQPVSLYCTSKLKLFEADRNLLEGLMVEEGSWKIQTNKDVWISLGHFSAHSTNPRIMHTILAQLLF